MRICFYGALTTAWKLRIEKNRTVGKKKRAPGKKKKPASE